MENSFAHIYECAVKNDKTEEANDLYRLAVANFSEGGGWLDPTDLLFFSDGSVYDGSFVHRKTIGWGKAFKTMQEWLEYRTKERGKPEPRPKKPKKKFQYKKKPKYDPEYHDHEPDYDDYGCGLDYEDTF
jgi:hypothetical protein